MLILSKIKECASKISVKVFLILIVCLVLPMYCMFGYMKSNFEEYIQKELSNKIIQSMSKSEQEIYRSFQNMANISSVLVLDNTLVQTLMDDQYSFYDKTLAFDSSVRNLIVNNLFTMSDVKITLIDLKGNLYSNWETNFNDYTFLMQQDWIKQSIEQNGYITWSMFSPGYIIQPNGKSEKYISMARSMLSDGMTGSRIGTLIISIEQSQFSELLARFFYAEGDGVYVCVDNGEILLKNTPENFIPDDRIIEKVKQVQENGLGSLRAEYKNKQYLVSYYTISQPYTFNGQKLRVLHYTDYQGVVNQMDKLSKQINFSMVIFLIIIILLIGFISYKIVKPIRVLAHQMRIYSINGELQNLDMVRKDEIGHLNRSFITMSDSIKDLFFKLEHEHEVREKYQFAALRAQVNPHFLFNTLNMIRWMALIRKAENIVDSIDALANMLKYSMSRGGELVSLDEELNNIRSYVFIQNARFGDRFQVKIEIEEELLQLQVIKFILQPVVENVVMHGFDEENGMIWIYGKREDDILKLYVKDNGKGIPPNVIDKFNHSKEQSGNDEKVTGIGLTNVNERIQVTYGEQFGIGIESIQGKGTIVTYTLPAIEGGKVIEEGYDR